MRFKYAFFILLLLPLAAAEVEVTYSGFLGEIDRNGEFSTTTTPVNNFHEIGFVCSAANCSDLGRKFSEESSAGNTLKVIYPTKLESSHGYGVYFYKQGYITWEVSANWAGNGRTTSTVYLSKKQGCFAPITNLVIVNEAEENIPAIINMSVSIDARTHAAIRNAGPLEAIPEELRNHYKVQTRVTLEVVNASNETMHTEAKNILIDFSNFEWVSFIWIPEKKGSYTLRITSEIIDEKCSSSETQEATGTMEVLEARPRNICYSPIKSFERDKDFPVENETITFSFEKISNFADAKALLAPVRSSVHIHFIKEGNLFSARSFLLPANQNANEFFPFSFFEQFPEGNYTAHLNIRANDSRCNNIPNLETNRTMNFNVLKQVTPPEPPRPLPELVFEIVSPENRSYNTRRIPLIISSNRNASFSYSLNSGERLHFVSPTTINAVQGSNTIEVFAENQSKRVVFFVDSIAPEVNIISPEARSYNTSSILMNITASDNNLKRVFFTINNGPEESYTSPFTRFFASGNYALKAFAEDALGNIGTSQVFFMVNITVPPNVSQPPPNNTNDTQPPSGGGGGRVKIIECIPKWKCTDWTSCDSTERQYRICEQEDVFCDRGESPEMTRQCEKTVKSISALQNQKLQPKYESSKMRTSQWLLLLLLISAIVELAIIITILV